MIHRTFSSFGLTLLFLLLVSGVLRAQDTTHSRGDGMHGMMDEQMAAMGPMMARMTSAMMAATYDNLAKPETAQKLATFVRNYYEALIAKGFAKDEALRIAASVGLPSTGGVRWAEAWPARGPVGARTSGFVGMAMPGLSR
jgi:hypothetical protein